MEHELGPEISVDGMPSWLDNDEQVKPRWDEDAWYPYIAPAYCVASPEAVTAIRLRADHPYYLATSKGFTYWPGGADAPDDWDGGPVLYASGDVQGSGIAEDWSAVEWRRTERILAVGSEIIGYRKRAEVRQQDATPARPSDELVERMIDYVRAFANGHYDVSLHMIDEAKEILTIINPDPMVQRARDICKDEFGVVLPDDAPGMRAVLRGLREGDC